jgi:hypothetical protein
MASVSLLMLNAIMGDEAARGAEFLIGIGMCILGMLWLIRVAEQGWRARHDPGSSFLVLLLLALAASPMMVSHLFSSRYVVGSLTVQLLALADWQTINYWTVGIMIVGATMGSALLGTYYW